MLRLRIFDLYLLSDKFNIHRNAFKRETLPDKTTEKIVLPRERTFGGRYISCDVVNKIRDIKERHELSGRTKKRSDRREPVTAFRGDGRGGSRRESEMAGQERSLEQEIGGMLPSLSGSRR